MTATTVQQQGSLRQQLVSGLAQLQLSLSDTVIDRLLQYQDALAFWNKAYNLTAIREPRDMLVKHLLDSLAIIQHLPAGRLLDVGTGGGMPGLIVALAQPERACVLLDSNGKKIRFLKQVCNDMQIANALPVQIRIEDVQAQRTLGLFDVVTSRAFASLTDFVRDCRVYLTDNGTLAAMKGVLPEDEMAALTDFDIQTLALQVPFLDEQRHLLLLKLRNEVMKTNL